MTKIKSLLQKRQTSLCPGHEWLAIVVLWFHWNVFILATATSTFFPRHFFPKTLSEPVSTLCQKDNNISATVFFYITLVLYLFYSNNRARTTNTDKKHYSSRLRFTGLQGLSFYQIARWNLNQNETFSSTKRKFSSEYHRPFIRLQCINRSHTCIYTVYPKKYAHGFCFAVLCCDYTLTDFPISIRLTSLALWQSNDCPSASKATLMNMDKYFMWIHYERLHNHNKAKHNKTVCIFLGIYYMGSELHHHCAYWWPSTWLCLAISKHHNDSIVIQVFYEFLLSIGDFDSPFCPYDAIQNGRRTLAMSLGISRVQIG